MMPAADIDVEMGEETQAGQSAVCLTIQASL